MSRDQRFLGVKELSEYLGVSRNTIYFWLSQRKVPYFKIGRFVKFDVKEIEKWLQDRKVKNLF